MPRMEKKHETQFYFSLFFLNRVAAFANNCNEVYKNEKLNKEMNGKEEEKRNKTPIK
jgi:heme oxygenase